MQVRVKQGALILLVLAGLFSVLRELAGQPGRGERRRGPRCF